MKWAELLVPFFNVIYVVIAALMIGLILMQRGAGAQAGSSFGAGASGTVFGAQGSANFLSRATAFCAIVFFLISIGMGMYISHGGRAAMTAASQPTGLMENYVDPTKAAAPASELPASEVPVAPPAVAPDATAVPTPVAPPATTPAEAQPVVPAEQAPQGASEPNK